MQQYLNPGDQHPFANQSNYNVGTDGLMAPPPLPGQQFTDNFMPPILRDPFVSGINAANQVGSFAAQAVPAAGNFQQQLYNPNMNNFEQSFLGSAGMLGMQGLNRAMNRIDQQYEGAPGHSARPQQYMDAGNQFAAQMLNTGSQMGLQRQQMATQNLPQAFNQPLQAVQSAQESASGLNNLAQNAMYQDQQYPQAVWSGTPLVTPTLIQGGSSGGGKK